jgi:exodeoxyribonuclease VII large subunit
MEPKTYTVTELNALIGNLIEDSFPRALYVEGEIGDYKKSASGHVYFTLLDQKSQIQCILWRSRAALLPESVADGTGVILRGKLNLYREGGRYSLIVETVEVAGKGLKSLRLRELKEALDKEGLFSPERKRPLPFLPGTVGVVTSPTGAAFKDIVKVIRRRNPHVSVILSPCRVQGEEAPGTIVRALKKLSASKEVQVIIVGRGGGSKEDLSAFDEEGVVRAVAASPCPVISAVGHEIDVSLTDLAADFRAETPSAAAELAVKSLSELDQERLKREMALVKAVRARLYEQKEERNRLNQRLRRRSPDSVLSSLFLKTDEIAGRLLRLASMTAEKTRQKTDTLVKRLLTQAGHLLLRRTQECGVLKAHLGRVAPVNRLQKAVSEKERMRARMEERLMFLMNEKRNAYMDFRTRLQGSSPLDPLQRGYVIVRKEGELVNDPAFLSPEDAVELEWRKGRAKARVTEVTPGKDENGSL